MPWTGVWAAQDRKEGRALGEGPCSPAPAQVSPGAWASHTPCLAFTFLSSVVLSWGCCDR